LNIVKDIRENFKKHDYPIVLVTCSVLLLLSSFYGNFVALMFATVLIVLAILVEHKLDRGQAEVEVNKEDES
jgi:hypothetical protein